MSEVLALPGGGHLAYAVRGEGRPLMLVSGLGGLASFWDAGGFAALCAGSGYSVIVHDHRGTGGSSRCDRPYSVPGMAADVLALMDHLGLDRVTLVGHSTGGAIGQVLTLEQLGRIERLVLSASWARPCAYFRRLFEGRLEILEHLGLAAYRRHAALLLNAPYWIATHDRLLYEELGSAGEHPLDTTITRCRIQAILGHDVLDRLGGIRCPTHIVTAADDAVTPAYHAQALATAIPRATLALLPRGGHYVQRAEPAAYAKAVMPFLASALSSNHKNRSISGPTARSNG